MSQPRISDARIERRPTPAQSFRRMRAAVRRAIGSAKYFRERRSIEHGAPFSEADLAAHWEWIITSLLRFGGASSGNAVTLFCNGDDMLESLWQSIDSAERQVWVE